MEDFISEKISAAANRRAELATIAQSHFGNYAREQIANFSKSAGREVYRQIKFSGRGSRAKNKHLREGTNLLAEEFAFQVTGFFFGEKDFGEVVVSTGENALKTYTKRKLKISW